MLKKLRRRWGIIPTWVKVAPIAVMLAGLMALHHQAPLDIDPVTSGVHRLFFVPLFMASLLFGLRGGLICAGIISLGNLSLLADPAPLRLSAWLNLGLEVGLYFLTGAITGYFVDRERREAERLKQSESLAVMGRAAAAVAHELKTPLVAIGGFALRIQRDMPEGHPHADMLRIIVDQVAHMEQLLREMLDYSRPLKLQLYPQSLNELVRDVVSMTKLAASESGVRVVEDLDEQLGHPVIDGPRVRQVVLNLVQNAIQASPRGSQIWVSTHLDGGQARVRVTDKGSGIPKGHRSQIFNPFFTTKSRGTGLGLAICRKIVGAHGGLLELVDRREKGSTFQMSLPLNGPAQTEP